jgi:tetratricopeptide (TPR) repeat protein
LIRRSSLGRAALVALLVGALSAAFAVAARMEHAVAAASSPRLGEAEVIELDLKFFEARVSRDPLSARDHAELARLHLQRARLSGAADADLARAERYARRSLALRTAHNVAAIQVLASSLMGRHRFAEALEVAERLVTVEAGSPAARALLGEVQLELGAYRDAAGTFGALLTERNDLSVAPRYARWEEIRGRPAEAWRLLRVALEQASARHGMPPSQIAWLHWRLGDLALRQGRLDLAGEELKAGLRLLPDDPRLLDASARVAAAGGRWETAAELGERALAQILDPATLALLATSYEALGDSARGAEYARAMEVAVSDQAGLTHRAWSLVLLDRGRDVAGLLAQAQREILTRRDVYGWDLLGWALYRAGRHGEALEAARQALALGTRDAGLWFHGGMIAASAGRPELARRRLEEALAINPRWHRTQPDEARAALRRLAAKGH